MGQVFKHYLKIDASDYGEGVTLGRPTSRKRPLRTDSMQEGAVPGNAGASSANRLESRPTDAGTPFLPEGVSPGVNAHGISCWRFNCCLHQLTAHAAFGELQSFSGPRPLISDFWWSK